MKRYFLKAPFFIKFIVVNSYGFILRQKRYNKQFYQYLDQYKRNDKTEVFSFDFKALKKQIKENKFYVENDKTIEKYPIINKQIIKEHYDEIINKKEVHGYLHTSGTTGSGLKYPISKEFINHQWAIFWKFRNLHGITLDTWCANIISQTLFSVEQNRPPYWIKSYPTRQLLLSQYHIRKDTVKLYLDAIHKNRIIWLHAFPSVLNLLANLIKDAGLLSEAKALHLKIITTSSEKLFDHQKKNIEDVFDCKVREFYGQVEGVANMFECEKGTLHIDESYSYVELVPTDNIDECKIVGTSYHNKSFPLVRYDTGDTCILYPNEFTCKCGRKSRVVKEILGRDDDYLLLTNGTKIGRISSIFKSLWAVKEAQIIQDKVGSAEFRIVKDATYSYQDEEKLKEQIKERLGNDFEFEIIYPDHIERTKSGKLKFVINKVNKNNDK